MKTESIYMHHITFASDKQFMMGRRGKYPLLRMFHFYSSNITIKGCSRSGCSLVPRPTPFFFVLRFAFSIIHGGGRAAKNGEGLGTLTT